MGVFQMMTFVLLLSNTLHGNAFSNFFSKLHTSRVFPLRSTTTADFHNGMTIISANLPCKIVEFQHVKPGKGGAFVRTKLRNILTNNILEKTFRAGEHIEDADIEKLSATFFFNKKDEYVFKENENSELHRTSQLVVGTASHFLKPKLEVKLVLWNEKIIEVVLPKVMEMKVMSCAAKGSASGSKKATLDTGVVINVPPFIAEGEDIMVNTDTREYSCGEKECLKKFYPTEVLSQRGRVVVKGKRSKVIVCFQPITMMSMC